MTHYFSPYASYSRSLYFLHGRNGCFAGTTKQRFDLSTDSFYDCIAPWRQDSVLTSLHHFMDMFGQCWIKYDEEKFLKEEKIFDLEKR